MKIVAIGDIHGQSHLLEPLLLQLEDTYLDAHTTVVFMGDYINRSRSPEACRQTLQLLQDFERRHPTQTFLLRGNHELNFLQNEEFEIDQMQISQEWELPIYREFRSLLESTLPYYETDDYFFSHAGGVSEDGDLVRRETTDADRFALYWRYDLPDQPYPKTIVRAHKIVPQEQVFGQHIISTDLGSYKTGKLGAILLPERLLMVSENSLEASHG